MRVALDSSNKRMMSRSSSIIPVCDSSKRHVSETTLTPEKESRHDDDDEKIKVFSSPDDGTLVSVALSSPPCGRSSSSFNQRRCPSISVEEDGVTEVTLESYSFSSRSSSSSSSSFRSVVLATPHPCQNRTLARAMSALLDADDASSPETVVPISPDTVVMDASSCCLHEKRDTPPTPRVVGCCTLPVASCWNGPPGGTEYLAKQICASLGSTEHTETWAFGWQAWSSVSSSKMMVAAERENVPPPEQADQVRQNLYRVLKNRAFHHEARKQRLHSLRRNLSPFHQSPKKATAPPMILKTRSFNLSSNAYTYKRDKASLPKKQSSLWSCGMNCALPQHEESPVFHRSFSIQEDDCYDSDPEDFVRRRPLRQFSSDRSASPSNKENIPPEVAFYTKYSVQGRVQALMNERLTLIMHQNSTSSKSAAAGSQGVHVWIERGQYLQRGIVQPKLHWKPMVPSPSSSSSLRPTSYSQPSKMGSVALLDIHRILPVENMDRRIYPFAKVQHCFLVKAMDQTILFEASSRIERDRIVDSLKLCVARLGSLLLSEDDGLMDEFFAGLEHGPGEQPYWLNSQESNNSTVEL